MKKFLLIIAFCSFISACAVRHTEVYFSPSLKCETEIINLLDNAQETIDVAIYSFNNENIAKAIYRAQKRNIKIRILADKTQAAQKDSFIRKFYDDGLEVRVASHYAIFHDKLAIIDGKKLFTGSYNWTERASHNNHEYCISIKKEAETIDKMKAEFENQWQFNTEKRSDLWFETQKAKETSLKK